MNVGRLLGKLGIVEPRFVEIEGKMRVLPEEASALEAWLAARKGVKPKGSPSFLDRFLDTPSNALLKKGASLRLRCVRDGSAARLKYKGPGFVRNGLLYRCEFSSADARPEMAEAMRRQLGKSVTARISGTPILALYRKKKFEVDLGGAFLEPSLDRVSVFRIGKAGDPRPLAVFHEFENEIKTGDGSLEAKLERLDDLLEFNEIVRRKFRLRREPLDKYGRCASFLAKP